MSLSLLAFWRHVVDAIFLKYSKEGRSSPSHEQIRSVLICLPDVCYDDTKHYQVSSVIFDIQIDLKMKHP